MAGGENIPEGEISKIRPEDGLESTWFAMHKAHEFATLNKDGAYLYTDTALEIMQNMWRNELTNPVRSERQKDEVEKILELIDFELTYRACDYDGEYEVFSNAG